MLILLPPSEGKTVPSSKRTLDLDALSFPSLDATRHRILAELMSQCRSDPDHAAVLLGLGPKQSDDIGRNADLLRQPCGPAIEVYSGVLFDALGYGTLSARARRRARQSLAISSALWGLVRPSDAIPAYRLSGSASLPGIGSLSGAWKGPVSALLAETPGLIVDLRSGAYVSLGPVPAAAKDRTVTVRVLQERGGQRTVVSHHNKATKGQLVRRLLESSVNPRTVKAFHQALLQLGFEAELPSPDLIDVVTD